MLTTDGITLSTASATAYRESGGTAGMLFRGGTEAGRGTAGGEGDVGLGAFSASAWANVVQAAAVSRAAVVWSEFWVVRDVLVWARECLEVA